MKLSTPAFAATVLLAIMPAPAAFAASNDTYATLHASEPPIPAGDGRIYFYREGGLMGVAIQPTIYIDGESTGGRSKPGDYFYIDRPAGTYAISTTTEKKESTSVTVAAGEAVYVKFEVSMGFFAGHVSPIVMDAAKAADQIKDCDWHAPQTVVTPVAPTASSAAPTTSDASAGAAGAQTPKPQ